MIRELQRMHRKRPDLLLPLRRYYPIAYVRKSYYIALRVQETLSGGAPGSRFAKGQMAHARRRLQPLYTTYTGSRASRDQLRYDGELSDFKNPKSRHGTHARTNRQTLSCTTHHASVN